jgi:hypothetical protein
MAENETRPLESVEQEMLLDIVDWPHSDYDDELDGWPNYTIGELDDGDRVLLASFLDADTGDILRGRWRLTFLGGEVVEGEPQATLDRDDLDEPGDEDLAAAEADDQIELGRTR